jgi:hypothetical protein
MAPCICNLPQNQWVIRSAKFIAENILQNLDDYWVLLGANETN